MHYVVLLTLAIVGLNTVSLLTVSLFNPVLISVASEVSAMIIKGSGVVIITGSDADLVEGSGVLKTESRQVDNFTAIDISGVFDVEIVAQQSPSLEISGDDNILPLVITEVRERTLLISLEKRKSISTKNKLKIKTSSSNIENISASGGNTIRLSHVNNETLSIDQSGSGKTELSGKTKDLQIELSGSSDLNAKNLYAQKVKVKISGAADAIVYAAQELIAKISGAGKINYYGNPKNVMRNISGVGRMKKK